MDARTTTTTVTTLLPAPPSSTLPSTARLPFSARGELSAALIQLLEGRLTTSAGLEPLVDASVERPSVIDDDDVQLALFLLYALSYGSLDQRGAQWEWDPELVRARTRLEGAFEAQVRTRVPVPELPEPSRPAVARALFALAAEPGGPSLARYVAKRATLPQLRELLVHRTV